MKAIERVDLIRKHKGDTISGLEKKIGVANQTLVRSLERKSNMREDIINAILNTYKDVSPLWLLRGEGQMIRVKDERKQLADYSVKEIVDYIIDFEDLFLKDRQFIELIDRLSEKGYRKEIEGEVRRIKEQIRKLGGSI